MFSSKARILPAVHLPVPEVRLFRLWTPSASQRRERRQMFQKRRLRVLILRGQIGVRVVRGRVVRGRRGDAALVPFVVVIASGCFGFVASGSFRRICSGAPPSRRISISSVSERLEPPVVRLGERRGGRAASAGDEIRKLFESRDGSFAFGRRVRLAGVRLRLASTSCVRGVPLGSPPTRGSPPSRTFRGRCPTSTLPRRCLFYGVGSS